MSTSPSLADLQNRSEKFLESSGRRPRILLSRLDRDTSATQLKALAVVFADAGFDVDIGPGFSTHDAIAKMACENDVHVVGISGRPADHEALERDLTGALANLGEEEIKIHVAIDAIGHRLMDTPADFDTLAARSADKTLTLIGA